MINAGKSIWAAFELNTARSSKYKISSTSLFICCCTSSSAFCSTWRPTNTILRIAVCRTMWEDKWKIYDKKSNIYFSTDGHFCWFGYLNQLGKYGSVHSIAFQTHWKENSLSSPSPLEIYLFQTPQPFGISVTLREGGMDIFWNHTFWIQYYLVKFTNEMNKKNTKKGTSIAL